MDEDEKKEFVRKNYIIEPTRHGYRIRYIGEGKNPLNFENPFIRLFVMTYVEKEYLKRKGPINV